MSKRRPPFDPDRERRRLSGQAWKDRDLHSGDAPRRLLNWQLDWRAYFRRFCAEHGGNPIDLGDRIVLPDGWSYSSTRYEGPEWPPPPEPELTRMMARYWTERRGIVSDELRHLKAARQGLKEAMVSRSVPLMKRVRRFDESFIGRDGKVGLHAWEAEEVGLAEIDERITWLADDVEMCERQLQQLKEVKA